jgi:DNA-binding SARP family transcriptional activator
VLGPLQAVGPHGPIDLGGHKQRVVLGMLLAHANTVVPMSVLVDAVWESRPPRRAERTVHSYIARLRRLVEPDHGPGTAPHVLVTRDSGYVLQVASGDVDSVRFEALLASARRLLDAGAAIEAAATLREALGLWRGPAYADLADVPGVAAEAERLQVLREGATLDRLDADLALGRHQDVAVESEQRLRELPYDERLWRQLVVATYRCGRQADALAACQRARRLLARDLGIDPGPELRALESAVLRQDPDLDPPAATPTAVETSPSGSVVFEGRQDALDVLRRCWREAAAGLGGGVLVSGPRGAGRTRLAAEFAREVAAAGATVQELILTASEIDDP